MYSQNEAQSPPSVEDLRAWAEKYEFTDMMYVATDPDSKHFNTLYPAEQKGQYMGMMLLKPGSVITKLSQVDESDIEAALPK